MSVHTHDHHHTLGDNDKSDVSDIPSNGSLSSPSLLNKGDENDNDNGDTDERQHQQRVSPSSPSSLFSLKEIISLQTVTKCVLAHPLETSRVLALNVNQFGAQVVGSAFDPERDVGCQNGKVILVTGGNGGLGKETISQLAKHRPSRIYLAGRNEQKCKQAILSIKSELVASVDIRYLQLDLASFKSIRDAAKIFISECDRLDTLVLNAGVMGLEPYTTEDGYEIQFGTNHMGHFLLTKLLLPTLRRTAACSEGKERSDVRVVCVSSIGWQMAPPLSVMTSTSALMESNRWTRYGASKAANILFAAEMARRYPEIMTVSIHPGVILTGLYDSGKASNFVIKYGLGALRPFSTSERKGAWNSLWAAGVDRKEMCNGEYYSPIGVKGWKNPYVYDEEAGKTLWEWTEQQVSGE